MPSFSFRVPQFLRSRRSRSHSPKPSPPRSRNDTGVPYYSPGISAPISEQPLNAATPTSQPLVSGHPIYPQGSAGQVFVVRAPDNFSDRSSQVPRPVTPVDISLVAQQSTTRLASPSNLAGLVQNQNPPAPPPAAYALTTPSQQSFSSEFLGQSSSRGLPQLQHQNIGMFNEATNFSASGNFIHGNVTYSTTTSNQFMKELLEKTIPGAEFDSSDRDPPPRCHPDTRLAILKRCLYFVSNCDGVKKIRWVVGAAGVGKSAIMQNVAESPDLQVNCHASIFFSINGRNDGTKAVITISYQFAAKSPLYRQIIEQEITRDPSLLRSSIAKQFKKFIIEPFISSPELNAAGRVLIIVDGLDECDNPRMQQELLRLICDFCVTHRSSPLVWLIASRPETHITSFFSRRHVIPVYEKEEILVDSPEACVDVKRFLRDKLTEIKEASDSLSREWPEERNFNKLADAAGGLFAYAHTVIRYIDDSAVRNPASQLSDVLHVIDAHLTTDRLREEHPMALLDALYDRILSNVPPKIMINTRKLLLVLASGWNLALADFSSTGGNFIVLCNWLGMTRDDAYAAVDYLRSVLVVPLRDNADREPLRPFHKSFIDYISDFSRSKFSPHIQDEAQQLKTACAFRVLKEAPDGINLGDVNYRFRYGVLLRGLGTGDKILLTWLVENEGTWNDDVTRLGLYKLAIGEVAAGIDRGDLAFQNEFCVRLLTTRFERYSHFFPRSQLCKSAFDGSRHPGFITYDILKQTSLGVVHTSELDKYHEVMSQFRRPDRELYFSDPWNTSCKHDREDQKEEEEKGWNWITRFFEQQCSFCAQRLKEQLKNWNNQSLDHVAPVLFTSTEECCLEFQSVDSKDSRSEWRHWVWVKLAREERRLYGSSA